MFPWVSLIPKSNRKIVTNHTYIPDISLSWLATGTSIKQSGGVKLVLWTQTLILSEMSYVISVSTFMTEINQNLKDLSNRSTIYLRHIISNQITHLSKFSIVNWTFVLYLFSNV
jgi:hypothetical protein